MTNDPFDDPQLRQLLQVKLWSNISICPEPGQRWEDACWLWQGKTSRRPEDPPHWEGHGYMQFHGKNYGTHRLAYELFAGEKVDPVLVVRHKCDRSRCCNPSHLETGTNLDNVADRVMRRRCATGVRNGAYTKPESRPKGETYRGATISAETAALIKGACQALGDGYGVSPSVARHFGVSLSVVKGIRNNAAWSEISPVIPSPLPALQKYTPAHLTLKGSGNAVLTPEQVVAMRKRYHDDPLNKHIVRELAEEFDVSKISVAKVLQLRTWAHVVTDYDPMPRGGHGMTVLTACTIQIIRATAAAYPGHKGLTSRLAERFNTTKTTVGRVIHRIQQPDVVDDPSKALTIEELDATKGSSHAPA